MNGWVGGWMDRRTDGWMDGWIDLDNMSKKGTVINIKQNLEILTTYINIIGKLNQAESSLTIRSREEKLNINICLWLKV